MSRTKTKVRPPPLALLVENDGDTREMYAEWLVHSGFRVAQAATADEAVEKAHRLRPHVITTDIGLSGDGDGCTLCERLKADARTKTIPVIAVTAWGGHVERARRAGCDSVLIKPCLPADLLFEIQRFLNRPMPATNTSASPSVLRTLLSTLTTEAARRSEDRRETPRAVLEQLITPLPVAALVADDAGSYILTNPLASQLTGYSTDELRRLSVWHLTPIANEREAESLWRAFLQQHEQSGDYELLTKNRRIVRAAYVARAHVLPGMHVSLLQPI